MDANTYRRLPNQANERAVKNEAVAKQGLANGSRALAIWGTYHFVSFHKALRYYNGESQDDVLNALGRGEIALGPPKLAERQRSYIDADGRYWIEETQA